MPNENENEGRWDEAHYLRTVKYLRDEVRFWRGIAERRHRLFWAAVIALPVAHLLAHYLLGGGK